MSKKIVRGFTSTVACNHKGACRVALDVVSFQGVQVTGEEIQSKYDVQRITITWIKRFKRLEKCQVAVDYVAEDTHANNPMVNGWGGITPCTLVCPPPPLLPSCCCYCCHCHHHTTSSSATVPGTGGSCVSSSSKRPTASSAGGNRPGNSTTLWKCCDSNWTTWKRTTVGTTVNTDCLNTL